MMDDSAQHNHGFTLVEVIVGSIVLAIVTGATTTAVSNLARAKSVSAARQQAVERAHTAAAMIATDALRLVRDHDLYFTRVVIQSDSRKGKPADDLLLIVRTIEPVRGLFGTPEGADFEVQYRLEAIEAGESDERDGLVMWRRMDPALDEYPTAGGVASVIAEGMVSFSVEAYDGQEWLETWDSDLDGLPHGLRIEVTATDDRGNRTVVARRVVAIDRTPLPIDTSDGDEGDDR